MSAVLRSISVSIVVSVCVWFAGVSDAHAVTLDPPSAAAGSVVDVVFHVTNDRTDAFTKRVQILFPNRPAVESAEVQGPPGWSSSVDASTGHVVTIDCDGGRTNDAPVLDFTVTIPVPLNDDRAVFAVLQTYSDGQVVRWTHDPAAGSSPDSRSAPVLDITGAVTTTSRPTVTATSTTVKTGTAAAKSGGSITTGRVFIAIGVALMVMVVLRQRRLRAERASKDGDGSVQS